MNKLAPSLLIVSAVAVLSLGSAVALNIKNKGTPLASGDFSASGGVDNTFGKLPQNRGENPDLDPENPVDPDEPEEPYEVYGNDESSSFSNAEYAYIGCYFANYFNDLGDEDFFYISLPQGKVISVYCSENCTMKLYRSNQELYYAKGSTTNSGKVLIDSADTYYVTVKSVGYFTGIYALTITDQTPSSSDAGKYYIRHNLNAPTSFGPELFSQDYSSKPDSGTKSHQLTYVSGSYSSIYLTDYTNIEQGADTNHYQYVSSDVSIKGVYNTSHVATNLKSDDDRTKVQYSDFPGDCVCHTRPYIDADGSYNIGTSFFVDQDYLFSAAHMAFNDSNNHFIRSMTVEIERNMNSSLFTLSCKEVYLPYSYFLSRIGGNINRAHDWSILKINHNDISSWYVHGYFGLQYDTSTSMSGDVLGYPAYYPNPDSPGTYSGEKFIDAVDYGSLSKSNGVWTTYMDITEGQSGGPLFIHTVSGYGQHNIYAKGMVSGGTVNSGGNKLASVNKYNFYLLSDLVSGNV